MCKLPFSETYRHRDLNVTLRCHPHGRVRAQREQQTASQPQQALSRPSPTELDLLGDRKVKEAGRTMSDTGRPDQLRDAFRVELRAEAIALAGRGWPVVPGTCVAGTQDGDAGEQAADWTRPEPVPQDWRERRSANPDEVAATWSRYPYSVLVATGTVLDAVEVASELGRRAARLFRTLGRPVPIAAMPDNRWLFLTRVAGSLPTSLAVDDVRWHGADSWVPLPPTPFTRGVVHWRVKPTAWGWRLPSPDVVHEVLAQALDGERSDTRARLATAEPKAA